MTKICNNIFNGVGRQVFSINITEMYVYLHYIYLLTHI